MGWFLAATAA